jgi:predicted DNA-binding transcriptional regulator YafY
VRASRLLSTLLLLQTRGRMTAREIADELQVSIRTVYRDVEALGAAGVPVYADRGPTGGYQLVDGYRTRLTGLTGDEAEALFLGGGPGPAAELGLGSVLAGAQLKLLAALPPELRARAARIRERFHLDAPGWFRDAEAPAYLDPVADAVWRQGRLLIQYKKWDNHEVERTIEPLGLVLKGVAWYVVARGRERVNAYRVSRILAVSTLDERFDRPDGFDLERYWQEWSQRLQQTLYKAEVLVRLSPRARELWFLSGPVAERALRESASEPDDQGWVRVVVPIESVEHGVVDLLRYGPDVEVLAPPELRARMREAAVALSRLYGVSP